MFSEVAVQVSRAHRALLAIVGVAALVGAGCGGDTNTGNQPPAPSIGLRSTQRLGNFLVDAGGRTLYLFGFDTPAAAAQPAVSNCTGGCVPLWPIFHVSSPTLATGLSASDFGELTRADGAKQTTFKGWPLYFYAGDSKAGDTNGDNLEAWYVVRDPFYSIVNRTKDEAGQHLFLADPTGRTLYVFAHDTVGTADAAPVSNCNGPCLVNFPIFLADGNVLPTGVDASRLTTFVRADGARQSAIDGHPLYFFSGDTSPGDTNAEGFNGVWNAADPSAL